MSIIARTRSSVKPTRSTVVLFDCSTIVKPGTFGRGILPSRPAYRAPYTAADEAEMAQVFGAISDARDAAIDRELDRRAAEAATLGALEAGYFLPADVGEHLSRTSLVGHPA